MGLSLASIVSSNYDAVLYLSINSQLKEVIHLHSSQHFFKYNFLAMDSHSANIQLIIKYFGKSLILGSSLKS